MSDYIIVFSPFFWTLINEAYFLYFTKNPFQFIGQMKLTMFTKETEIVFRNYQFILKASSLFSLEYWKRKSQKLTELHILHKINSPVKSICSLFSETKSGDIVCFLSSLSFETFFLFPIMLKKGLKMAKQKRAYKKQLCISYFRLYISLV